MTDKNIILVRQWWLCYFALLQNGGPSDIQESFNSITKRLEKLDTIVQGQPMTREGAEDLAKHCDEARMFANATRKEAKP